MEKESFEQQLKQSEQEFREQFDLNSEKHHKGWNQPVPIGGTRVPQSMPQQHPQNFNPAEQGPTSQELGEEYIKLEKQREVLISLKKILAKQAPLVEAIYRHNEHFGEKADKSNPGHIEKHRANIEKEVNQLMTQEKQLVAVNKQLSNIAQNLASVGNEYKDTEKDIELIIKDSLRHYETKEDLTDFGFRSKKVSAKSFADAQKLLDAMKKIKKNYKKPEGQGNNTQVKKANE